MGGWKVINTCMVYSRNYINSSLFSISDCSCQFWWPGNWSSDEKAAQCQCTSYLQCTPTPHVLSMCWDIIISSSHIEAPHVRAGSQGLSDQRGQRPPQPSVIVTELYTGQTFQSPVNTQVNCEQSGNGHQKHHRVTFSDPCNLLNSYL